MGFLRSFIYTNFLFLVSQSLGPFYFSLFSMEEMKGYYLRYVSNSAWATPDTPRRMEPIAPGGYHENKIAWRCIVAMHLLGTWVSISRQLQPITQHSRFWKEPFRIFLPESSQKLGSGHSYLVHHRREGHRTPHFDLDSWISG